MRKCTESRCERGLRLKKGESEFIGWTDSNGVRLDDAPDPWPFGALSEALQRKRQRAAATAEYQRARAKIVELMEYGKAAF